MILILEDDADREAFRRGYPLNPDIPVDERPDVMVWISPEAYAKEVVLADLRAKVDALAQSQMLVGSGSWVTVVAYDDVLALIDGSDG